VDISGATGALINVSGGTNMTLDEAKQIVETISERLDEDARIIWGAQIQEDLDKTIRTLVIITGINSPQIKGKSTIIEQKKDLKYDLGIDFID